MNTFRQRVTLWIPLLVAACVGCEQAPTTRPGSAQGVLNSETVFAICVIGEAPVAVVVIRGDAIGLGIGKFGEEMDGEIYVFTGNVSYDDKNSTPWELRVDKKKMNGAFHFRRPNPLYIEFAEGKTTLIAVDKNGAIETKLTEPLAITDVRNKVDERFLQEYVERHAPR